MERIRGIDSIRAVCALWVLFSHFGGPPILAGIDKTTRIGWLLNGIYNNFWNGPAAVIIFFVISGFCIHYPQSDSGKLNSLFGFYLRRFLRILIPLACAIGLSFLWGGRLDQFNDSILWSLVCEIIYYFIYPLFLFFVRRGLSWNSVFFGSFIVSILVAASKPQSGSYPSYGPLLNWALGLPCWLLGCLVAEWVKKGFPLSALAKISIWKMRIGVFVVSILVSAIRFHTPVGYPWTLNWFGILSAIWLYLEIMHFKKHEPNMFLERVGLFSYSIYLIHVPLHELLSKFSIPNLGFLLNWVVGTIIVLSGCWLFYWLIEKPSHALAKNLGRLAFCK